MPSPSPVACDIISDRSTCSYPCSLCSEFLVPSAASETVKPFFTFSLVRGCLKVLVFACLFFLHRRNVYVYSRNKNKEYGAPQLLPVHVAILIMFVFCALANAVVAFLLLAVSSYDDRHAILPLHI